MRRRTLIASLVLLLMLAALAGCQTPASVPPTPTAGVAMATETAVQAEAPTATVVAPAIAANATENPAPPTATEPATPTATLEPPATATVQPAAPTATADLAATTPITTPAPAAATAIAQLLGTPTAAPSCAATEPDQLGPFYVPNAPERSKVGQGYVLSGVVRSSQGCAPIPGAKVEAWMAGPDGQYADAYRATMFAGPDGTYRFESHFPPPYSGRPSHIHLMVTADGYQQLVTQHYPVQGASQATFDLVLRPAS